jgi:hypothetical protein
MSMMSSLVGVTNGPTRQVRPRRSPHASRRLYLVVKICHVFAALAEFIRTIIVANTNGGLAAARARGQRLGRPAAMTPEKVAYALQLLGEPDRTISSIAKLVGVSRSTLYTYLPELLPAQRGPAALDTHLES